MRRTSDIYYEKEKQEKYEEQADIYSFMNITVLKGNHFYKSRLYPVVFVKVL